MIIYASRTGNIKYICSQLSVECMNIGEVSQVNDFFIFTYTDKLGEIPLQVKDFMIKYNHKCKGVIVSGNTNFGMNNFAKAGDILSQMYGIPLIAKVELRGFKSDYELIEKKYMEVFK